MVKHHPLVELARRTIETYVREETRIEPPRELAGEMKRRAGTFVTIRKHGQLRGCIGTIHPTCDNIAEEVINNAISAATRDPRFERVDPDELNQLEVKVDVLGDPEPVDSESELDPKRYGLIIQSLEDPRKRGLLLPNLDGIDTVEKQVRWTRYHKALITDPDEPVQMFRFEVMRYT